MSVTLTPAETSKKITEIARDAFEIAKQLPKTDSLITLLTLEDAYYSFKAIVLLDMMGVGEHVASEDIERVALNRHVDQQLALIDRAIYIGLELSKAVPRLLSRIPAMEVGVTPDPNVFIAKRRVEGYPVEHEHYFFSPIRMMGTFHTIAAIALLSPVQEDIIKQTRRLLDWLQRIRRVILYYQAIHMGYSLTEIEGVETPRVNYPEGLDLNRVAESEWNSLRHVLGTSWTSAGWDTKFREATRKNFLQTYKGVDSFSNRQLLAKELDTLSSSYRKFPNYERVFIDQVGYGLGTFLEATKALLDMSRNTPHQLYYDLPRRLVRDLRTKAGLPEAEAMQVVDSLKWDKGLNPTFYPIYDLGSYYLYSMYRILAAFNYRHESIMSRLYKDTDAKGSVFESTCRDTLTHRGFDVYPDKVIVHQQVIPDGVSERLWKKVKRATDFDAFAKREGFLLVIECKEIKLPHRRLVKTSNEFKKYAEEHYHKSRWVSQNLEVLERLMPISNGKFFADRFSLKYLAPVIVSTFPVDTDRAFGVPVLTVTEFDSLCEKIGDLELIGRDGETRLILRDVVLGTEMEATVFPL